MMAPALEELRSFVHDGTVQTGEQVEGTARDVVLAALDAALDETNEEFADFVQIGSMLLVQHQGLPSRSWAVIADILARMLPRPDASVPDQAQG